MVTTRDAEMKEWMRDWAQRKMQRVLHDAASTQRLGVVEVPVERVTYEVHRAQRSLGYRSGYKPVPTYWVIATRDSICIAALRLTERAYLTKRKAMHAKYGVWLPV